VVSLSVRRSLEHDRNPLRNLHVTATGRCRSITPSRDREEWGNIIRIVRWHADDS